MKVLVILASGIGNSILFGPTLKEIKKNFPDSEIDIFSYKKQFAEPFEGSSLINKIFVYGGYKTIKELRKQKYDVSITAFPSNKWQFNLFAYIIGAKKRITHSYKGGKIKTLSFLQNNKIPADENLHDVEQNLNLLKLLNIDLPKDKELFFYINKENKKFAENFIKNNKLENKCIIGVHPGSGPLLWKKASKENFLEEINKIKEKNKAILIFGGPEEKVIKEDFQKSLKEPSFTIDTSLKNTAALISKCNYFITNDTGLMHIATAMEMPEIIVFFNGTNQTRTRPYTQKAKIITLRENKLKYPFWSTKAEEE